MSKQKVAGAIAEQLYDKMRDLGRDSDFEWVVHKSEFLPANVTCDYAGRCNFVNMMTSVILEELERVKTQI